MSRFVSAGTSEDPPERSDDWIKAQEDLDRERRQKELQSKPDGGKSLYEVLQANKAAKQEAFEESIRLKNQFRSLDEDEVDFLDSVLESTRAKDAAVQKETMEQLEAFRRQRESVEKPSLNEEAEPETQWNVSGKKRKKAHDKDAFKGIKLRKSSSTTEELAKEAKDQEQTDKSRATLPRKDSKEQNSTILTAQKQSETLQPQPASEEKPLTISSSRPSKDEPPKGVLGLSGYSSESE